MRLEEAGRGQCAGPCRPRRSLAGMCVRWPCLRNNKEATIVTRTEGVKIDSRSDKSDSRSFKALRGLVWILAFKWNGSHCW